MKKFCFHLIIGVLLQPLGRRVDLEGYYKAIVTPGTCIRTCISNQFKEDRRQIVVALNI